MTRRFLKNSTILAMSLSLALPQFGYAQTTAEAGAAASAETEEDAIKKLQQQLEGAASAEAPAEAGQPAVEAAPEAVPVAAPEAAAEEVKPEAQAEEPKPEVQEEPKPEAQAEDVKPAEAPASQEEPKPEAMTETPAAEEAPAAEAPVVADAPAEEVKPVAEVTPEATATSAAEQAEVQRAKDEAEAERLSTEQAATASVAATAEAEAGSAEVVEETVTEESARSSSEEFATKVAPATRAADDVVIPDAAAPQPKNGDGLSTAAKIAIVGLGALAVGQLLKNGDKVVANSGDRVVVEKDGTYRVLKDDNVLLRQPGSNVRTERFGDGSTRSTVTYQDGTQVVTVAAPDGRILRRTRYLADGREFLLIDDTREVAPVRVSELPKVKAPKASNSNDPLRLALLAAASAPTDRMFSLAQIRQIDAVRKLVPEISVEAVKFATGSAVIRPEEARSLSALGQAIREAIDANPAEIFLVEGHTDAVGNAGYNLALSDRRAETLALALTEYFDVPPENLVVQGYGESDLKIATPEAETLNRRAAVRRITSLLNGG
jgi:outer membrane protein OmpA-like peptidoglycan-associated protein